MNERGFQLVELMLVCGLAAALVAVGGGSIWSSIRHHRLQIGSQDFVAALTSARSLALTANVTSEMRVHSDRRRFSAAVGERLEGWRHLPPGVEFAQVPAGSVRFHSRGSAVPAGTFRLAGPTGSIRVIVAPTGRIRWEHD